MSAVALVVVVAVLGLAVIVWLVLAAVSRHAPSEMVSGTQDQGLLRASGPDDPAP